MNADQMFGGMAKAEIFGKGNFMQPGQYRVAAKLFKFNDGFKGRFFIFEFTVLETSNPEKHAVGSSASWVVKLSDNPTKNGNAFSDIKSLAFALTGVDPKTVKKPEEDPKAHNAATETIKAACDPEYAKKIGAPVDALIGVEVYLETIQVPMVSKPGELFTRHSWSPTPEMVALRKATDAG